MIIILTGVCGSGKTVVGKELASLIGWKFVDGDDYHPDANVEKMAKGISLTDEDRIPWLRNIHNEICRLQSANVSGIIACSALKTFYRRILQHGDQSLSDAPASATDILSTAAAGDTLTTSNHEDNTNKIVFVLLKGDMKLLSERMQSRVGHFMPVCLLQSQLDTLEDPDEQTLVVDVHKSIPEIVRLIIDSCNLHAPSTLTLG